MGAKQAVGVVHRKAIAAADDPAAEHDRLAAEYEAEHVSAAIAAREGFIDELVEPRDTRRRLAGALVGAVERRRVRQRRREHPAVTTYVALGDSFTAGTEPGEPRWPDELARRSAGRPLREPRGGRARPASDVEPEQLERALELRRTWSRSSAAPTTCSSTRARTPTPTPSGWRGCSRACGAERPERDDPHRDLPGHLALPRPAPAVADARGAGDAAVQRRLPRRGPASRGRAARGLRPPGHERARRASPRTASTSARRATGAAAREFLRALRKRFRPARARRDGDWRRGPCFERDFDAAAPAGERFTHATAAGRSREPDILAVRRPSPATLIRSTSTPTGPPAPASASRSRTGCSCCPSPSACCRSTRSGWSRCAAWATPCSSNL